MTVCAHCGEWRERTQLLLVTDLRTGETRYICRPGLSPACFHDGVRSADLDRIEAA